MIFRVARHTNNITAIQDFYTQVLGLKLLGSFEQHDGYDGIFLVYKMPRGIWSLPNQTMLHNIILMKTIYLFFTQQTNNITIWYVTISTSITSNFNNLKIHIGLFMAFKFKTQTVMASSSANKN